ncbi:MAG: DNA primase [Planctomycetota bacterium]|jgi:DNA primase|nr:DNA primase [Planctomycetota bacterium]
MPLEVDLQELTSRIKDRVEIEAVIARKVRLTRKGNRLWGLCPFHSEKTPSFTVEPARGFFKCFGCGEGGDVISFVMKQDGLEFWEALTLLADEAGVEIPRLSGASAPSPLRDKAREALSLTRSLFHQELGSPSGSGARKYLEDREVSSRMWEHFSLGWAPAEPGWLSQRLRKAGIPDEAMVEAGLAYFVEGTRRLRDRFWDRLMFPVADRSGRTVGFCARFLPGSQSEKRGMGKYVNSPEGPLFPKRRLLYGLDLLADGLREAGEDTPIYLVEGNLDVVMLHQSGYPTTLAALGTSITEDHARALRRHKRPVFLVLDADEAGKKAAWKAGRLMVAEGIPVKVVMLPDGEDPASMISAGNEAQLSQRLDSAWDILDWRLEVWTKKPDFQDPAVQVKAAREIAEWISSTPDPALAEIWSRRAGDRLGLTTESLRRMTENQSQDLSPKAVMSAGNQPPKKKPAQEALKKNEFEILAALLHDSSLFPRHRQELEALELGSSVPKRLLSWCRERRLQSLPFDLFAALREFPEGDTQAFLEAIRQNQPINPEIALESALQALSSNREMAYKESRKEERMEQGELSDSELSNLQRKIDLSASDEHP